MRKDRIVFIIRVLHFRVFFIECYPKFTAIQPKKISLIISECEGETSVFKRKPVGAEYRPDEFHGEKISERKTAKMLTWIPIPCLQ